MKRKFLALFSIAVIICMLTLVFAACTPKMSQLPGQGSTTQQRGNMMGGNMPGGTPGPGTNTGVAPGTGIMPGTTPVPGIGIGMVPGTSPGMGPTPGGTTGMGKTPGGTTGIIPTPGAAGMNRINQVVPSRTIGFSFQKADNILSQLGKVDGARQINAVVKGNTCLVGCTPDTASRNARSIKNTIAAKVKKIDGTIKNVVVSDSPITSARIKKLSDRVRANMPAKEVEAEFSRLMQIVKSTGK